MMPRWEDKELVTIQEEEQNYTLDKRPKHQIFAEVAGETNLQQPSDPNKDSE